MKETIKITGVLTSVCVICAFGLAFVFNTAKDKIEENAKKRINQSIFKIEPDTVNVEKIFSDNNVIYKLFNDTNKIIGYAFLADGQGYQGKIKILSVSDPTLKHLIGIEIIDSVETPGLGAKIGDPSFKDQFKGLNTLPKIVYIKDTVEKSNQIQAITGATISSKAVVNILNQRLLKLKDELSL
ncbi:MAG: FMN-binding protein [Candidatus Omnitrophota bacterium]|nr:FMN-binding protein [Candidatus Omnitrophota bacterium]